MILLSDFKKADGSYDQDAYEAAYKAERNSDIASGKYCSDCGTYIVFGRGYRDSCSDCKRMKSDDADVTHDRAIRCPHCKHVTTLDGDDYDLYAEGEHEINCDECNEDFQITTSVSYSFTSPALGKKSTDED